MNKLGDEIIKFLGRRDAWARSLTANGTLFAMTGSDLQQASAEMPAQRKALLLRVKRLLERERLNGLKRHHTYDLNRHIALKRAYDLLRKINPQ